jgi:hypothetical protein
MFVGSGKLAVLGNRDCMQATALSQRGRPSTSLRLVNVELGHPKAPLIAPAAMEISSSTALTRSISFVRS